MNLSKAESRGIAGNMGKFMNGGERGRCVEEVWKCREGGDV